MADYDAGYMFGSDEVFINPGASSANYGDSVIRPLLNPKGTKPNFSNQQSNGDNSINRNSFPSNTDSSSTRLMQENMKNYFEKTMKDRELADLKRKLEETQQRNDMFLIFIVCLIVYIIYSFNTFNAYRQPQYIHFQPSMPSGSLNNMNNTGSIGTLQPNYNPGSASTLVG
jgi:hypothetical protein